MCGFHSELQFGVLAEYMVDYDISCLSETITDDITVSDIFGYKAFISQKQNVRHNFGGIHGLCI